MTKLKILAAGFFILIIIILPSPTRAQAKSDDLLANELMNNYLDLIRSGNYESALGLWESKALEQSLRLGISFDDIPIKPDCHSPVMYDYNRVKEFFYNGIQSIGVIDSIEGVRRLRFSVTLGTERIDYHYYARKIGQDYWIIFPHDYYAENWSVKESKYFRFHINPKQTKYYNERAAACLDDFVERTAAKLAVAAEPMRYLSIAKIDYYLCQSESEVGLFSNGPDAKGVYDLGSDAIFSVVFPHYHEVAHLLVNYKLKELPLYTVSFLQEGLAVYLGGRWQRAAEVMIDFGKYIVDKGIVDIDSALIENDSLSEVSSDIAYPVAATLTDYILSSYPADKFWQLYRALSGNLEFHRTVAIDSVKKAMTAVTGKTWEQFADDFDKFLAARKPRGGAIYPGAVSGGKTIFDSDSVTVAVNDQWLQIESVGDTARKVDFNLVFGFDTSMVDRVSSLFEEQYPIGMKFDGFRFGIRMDKNEAGLYDYFANQLKAKYVFDFDPSQEYYDSTANKYSIHIDLNLLEGVVPAEKDFKILK